ncbi:MAG: ROK family protein [Planctomycetota bacterium]
MSERLLGIDIGGTAVKVAIRNDRGWRVGTSDRYSRPDRSELQSAIRDAVGRVGPHGTASAVGLCVPGIPSEDGSKVVTAVNVPGLEAWPFDELVRDAIGAPAEMHRTNDAAAATVDWVESHGASGRVAGIAIGTGVGLSIVDDGVPVCWTDGAAGHLGQIDVTVGDAASAPVGPDGGRGGLEAYVGVAAVREAGGIEAAFESGATATIALARAIRVVNAMYRPDAVVLLGGVGIRLATMAGLDAAVRADLTSLARPGWVLAFGDDDHHAARGAARLASNQL